MVPSYFTILFRWSRFAFFLPFCCATAFLGSCNSIRLLVFQLLSLEFHKLTFPGEDVAATVFENFSSNVSISVASHHDLQAVLDQHQYDQLFASLNIREQAHLTALSHSSGTSTVEPQLSEPQEWSISLKNTFP